MQTGRNGLWVIVMILTGVVAHSQTITNADRYTQPGVDVLHYDFALVLSDSTNQIRGEATIRFTRADDRQTVWFDLISPQTDSSAGMRVRAVQLADGKSAPFTQRNNRVFINLPAKLDSPGQPTSVTIRYDGTPARGLIISRNKFGDRTFFGDNWPNNARNWLPVVDHPSDKATCSFTVNAPADYRIIANGKLLSEEPVPGSTIPRKRTRWQENTPIPTKVMVIGAARFSVDEVGAVGGVPVQSWLYPNDSQKGFIDYRPAKEILQYFIDKIGPYSYEKLANVESTTVFGGMENASCIFYNEKIIVGKKDSDVEALLAHEIAHQWFGNSATEADWSQLWLSEGFATYFSALYLEHAYGRDTLNAVLNQNKKQIFRYAVKNPNGTVIDSTTTNLVDLLNANSYQKGGWVLHMLRSELGNDVFWRGIRAYYATYRNANARTTDFQAVMEKESGKDLGQFFRQWLNQPGFPEVVWESHYDAGKRQVVIDVRQIQKSGLLFTVPLVFSIRNASGREMQRTPRLLLNQQSQTFTIPLGTKPAQLVIDPDNTILMRTDATEPAQPGR